MKKAFVLAFSFLFLLSFTLCAFAISAEAAPRGSILDSIFNNIDSSYNNPSPNPGGPKAEKPQGPNEEMGDDFGNMITDIIGKFGGESDFDYSGIFSGIGAFADIDVGGYLTNINVGSLAEDFQTFLGNFLNFDDISMDGLGGIFNDLGLGDLTALVQDGFGDILGIGGEGANIGEGGFTDFISGVAGSIADMTGDFDISELIAGLTGGSGSSGNSSNNDNDKGEDIVITPPPSTPPPSNTGGTPSITPPIVITPSEDDNEEIETQEFTTQTRYIIKQTDDDNNDINEPVKERNTNKIVAGIILVLGSFGTVAYLVVKKVI